MLSFAALTGPLPRVGLLAAVILAASAIVAREERLRAASVIGALILTPVLLAADVWDDSQLRSLRHHPAVLGVVVIVGLVALAAASVVLHRRPRLLAPLACLALPFRVPISSGGTTSNLLVPLYFVIAASALGWAVPVLWGAWSARSSGAVLQREHRERIRLFEWALAAYIVLYALQALYSHDFPKALQNSVFFYVPFALLFVGLRSLEWDRRLVLECLAITVALACLGALIGYVEEVTKHLLWNQRLIDSDQQHKYFEVNSFFYDPNIFGRYLSLVMILVAAVLVYSDRVKVQVGTLVVSAVLWGALVFTLSRSSLLALLLGLAVIGALRWRAAPVLALAGVLALVGLIALIASPKTFGINQGWNNASSGRANLISGGEHLFKQRPLWGHGSGSFTTEYRRDYPHAALAASDSHNIPVTIAAEQGLIGLLVYLLLVLSALFTLLRGARGDPARVAIAATFLALLLHTMLYADFLEDPTSWVLLGIGGALAVGRMKDPGERTPTVHQKPTRELHRA